MRIMRTAPAFTFTVDGVRLRVPAYHYTFPAVSLAQGTMGAYVKFLPYSAREITEHLTDVMADGWKYRAKWFQRYWATWYYKQYPDLLLPDGTLLGYDASMLMRYFWPGETPTGGKKDYLRKELDGWATTARATLATQESQATLAPHEGTTLTNGD